MEMENNERINKEVCLKTKWYEAIKKAPISNAVLFLMFFGGSLLMLFTGFSTGDKESFFMGSIALLFYILLNIPIILRILKPIEYVVRINGDLLTIYKNGKTWYSITSQETNKIVLSVFLRKIIGIVFFKSSGEWKQWKMNYISKDEAMELMKLLQDFYGEQRFSELISR